MDSGFVAYRVNAPIRVRTALLYLALLISNWTDSTKTMTSTTVNTDSNEILYTKQVAGIFAFAGDLSMGQPPEHSLLSAYIAHSLATLLGYSDDTVSISCQLSILRWSGCTANAQEFADLFGDDVKGREKLLGLKNPFSQGSIPPNDIMPLLGLTRIAHCEATREIARRLNLSPKLLAASEDLFQYWGGFGLPDDRKGDEIDIHAQIVTMAGDLEIWDRVYGSERATELIQQEAGKKYNPDIVAIVIEKLMPKLSHYRQKTPLSVVLDLACFPEGELSNLNPMALLLADYVDLKIPTEVGLSRRVANNIRRIGEAAKLNPPIVDQLYRAALLYKLGQVSVSNNALHDTAINLPNNREDIRLIPYWTERMLSRAPALAEEARWASFAYERLDGSGFYRGATAAMTPLPARLLQSAIILSHLQNQGKTESVIRTTLAELAEQNKLDKQAVECTVAILSDVRSMPAQRPMLNLSGREQQVLEKLSQGHSNKAIAQLLQLSPKTVGTYVESLYRKLEVSSRAAAVLRAMDRGLLTLR